MKNFGMILILLFTLSCSNKVDIDNEDSSKLSNLDWLQGRWIRTNSEIGKRTLESWKKVNSDNYIGLGFTLENSDTIFKENLKLVKTNGTWSFEVRGVNTEMTPFVFINQSDTSFVCENKTNEFPKRIEYTINNNLLTANISDDKMKITFIFEKIDQ